jgi:erythritol transport system ATP-binding protein
VVTDLHQDEIAADALGVAGAAFLAAEMAKGEPMLIGVGYGRTLAAAVEGVPEAPHVRLVSLMGSQSLRSGSNPHEVIARLSQRTGASAELLPLPLMATSTDERAALLGQPGVAAAFDLAGRADLMFVGIGTTIDDASLVSTGMIEPADMALIRQAGAVGELLGHFFLPDGRRVVTEATERVITQPLELLRGRRIVAVAGGPIKVDAVRAVLASGLLSGLITDERTARAVSEPATAPSARTLEPAQ